MKYTFQKQTSTENNIWLQETKAVPLLPFSFYLLIIKTSMLQVHPMRRNFPIIFSTKSSWNIDKIIFLSEYLNKMLQSMQETFQNMENLHVQNIVHRKIYVTLDVVTLALVVL